MSTIERRVDARLRTDWPGSRTLPDGEIHTYPPVRPGGSTDTLIKLAAAVAADEAPLDYQSLVREFHEVFGHPIADRPTLVDQDTWQLRYDLIFEELEEYLEACKLGNLTKVADALGDILYVTFGAGLVHGINLAPIFEEIQRSNMTKLGLDGLPIFREDGKILKGPNYQDPFIEPIVLQQQESGAWA